MPTKRAKRVAVRLPVSVGRKMAALSADISAEGFCLEVMRPIEKGTEIDGYVLHGDHELAFTGTVAWCEPANPQASHWSKIGVKFNTLSPGLRALLSIKRRIPRPAVD